MGGGRAYPRAGFARGYWFWAGGRVYSRAGVGQAIGFWAGGRPYPRADVRRNSGIGTVAFSPLTDLVRYHMFSSVLDQSVEFFHRNFKLSQLLVRFCLIEHGSS